MKVFAIALLFWSAPLLAQTGAPDPLRQVPSETVVAVVDGEAITLADVEAFSNTRDPKKLFQLNQQVFEFRESMLGLMLGERLLKLEAQKARLTVEELLEKRLKIEPVTDAEIQEVLSRQPSGSVDPAVLIPLIREFLVERKKEQARARYVAEMIAKAKKAPKPVVIHLQPPRQAITVDSSDPVKGQGEINVVEFSDFECPFCQKFQPVLKQVLSEFDGKVKHVWKDFPLPMHQNAMTAAVAARCAHEQGLFWEYHDVLFANQHALAPADLKKHASAVNLNLQAFNACLDAGKYLNQLQTALKDASAYTVPATPTVFINGRMVMGVAAPEVYTRIINEELGN
jgi:protein-disulfide isomerase